MNDRTREREDELLAKSLHDFRNPTGRNFEERAGPFAAWVDQSAELGLFQFIRSHDTAPAATSRVTDFGGNVYEGINLASQDYLGLARDPLVIAAVMSACAAHGAHSSGSEPMGGGMTAAQGLSRTIAALVEHEHVVLFPTGWGAGYGGIKGIVRESDHVVIDALAHDCLQHGARASTPNITHFAHNSIESLEKRLGRIRAREPDAAILVVTESLFSMDTDHPDFVALFSACQKHDAHVMVDIAHDLGVVSMRVVHPS